MWRRRSPCRSKATTWWWICSGRHCEIRSVGKGVSAPCPPSITDRASKGWARSALPTLRSLEGAARDANKLATRSAALRRCSAGLIDTRSGPSAEGSIRAFQRGPIKLRLRRRSLHGFGRGLYGCICERSWSHLRVRRLGHVFSAQRSAKMHRASTHLPTEHCVLRLSNLPFRHELGGAVGHRLDPAFSFSEVVAATSDADRRGVMDVRGICGHKSISTCSHCGCT